MVELTEEYLDIPVIAAARVAKDYRNLRDEMESAALVALVEAARRYEDYANRGGKKGFRHYAYRRCVWAAKVVVKKEYNLTNADYPHAVRDGGKILCIMHPGEWVAVCDLAKATQMSERSVRYALDRLIADRKVEERDGWSGVGKRNKRFYILYGTERD